MAGDAVVVSGSIAQRPGVGGHAWVFLQYLLGFRRLGFDVLFLDRAASGDAAWVERVLAPHAIPYALLGANGEVAAGLPRSEALARTRRSLFLLNVMGFLDDEELLAAAPRRVFLDIDPGFGQMWRELGLADVFAGHDVHVTIGENVGGPGCGIPTCGLEWVTTPQPVVLEQWPAADGGGGAFTTVASWRGPFAPVEYAGTTYGLRVHEFRRFASLPRRSGRAFEAALAIDPEERRDLELLARGGWRLVDPLAVGADPGAYREYVRGSRSEFTVAKGMYVQTRSGWVSDRSICYLASGKPVLAQDTGLAERYPVGEGLLTFSTLEEALAGVEEIESDYPRHARAARALAEERFDSDRVLRRLVEAVAA